MWERETLIKPPKAFGRGHKQVTYNNNKTLHTPKATQTNRQASCVLRSHTGRQIPKIALLGGGSLPGAAFVWSSSNNNMLRIDVRSPKACGVVKQEVITASSSHIINDKCWHSFFVYHGGNHSSLFICRSPNCMSCCCKHENASLPVNNFLSS